MVTSYKPKHRSPSSRAKSKHTKANKRPSPPHRARLRSGELGRASAPAVAARGKVIPKTPVPVDLNARPAYTKAIDFLMSHTDYEKMRVVRYNTTTFNLDRMRTLLKHLGNPHTKFKTAHVAGTKGKG